MSQERTGEQQKQQKQQDPDIGPLQKLPGFSVDEAKDKPHRALTDEECTRLNLPTGTLLLINPEEVRNGVTPEVASTLNFPSVEQQVTEWMRLRRLKPWTGREVPRFASTGQPVPPEIFVGNLTQIQSNQPLPQMSLYGSQTSMGSMPENRPNGQLYYETNLIGQG
ncbi:hypothetical protein GUITHDRAFT_109078 [Guillardia theta CCMP2712]|uniref:Uncharacterized protein n=1 Tax=Guillardia theta (strain CCMP2712) TaxID=905079 RepID=L1J8Z7_GUITC|nr:hypothetical protein GUITHDRAFT_109078 [Guillardia theta CCMP2712]EKX45033.1 hypothetical protein GUITHDRAFT_109078 [Guillardia theta CCMP2712]|mmetsp:Transcript_8286/g.27885  ORF Transcript_8286/g.27885 Transcript_8286/m.27885 type:complete len:166 (-) Transcript_8286:197-694(-)|eukprot:XP_005832013.1 hypothetical protein GUITHDRAFT_109078 [Guillardia theta CCMP2712]